MIYVVGLFSGWLDWRGKVSPSSLVVASDITALRPYIEPLVLNRILVGATTLLLLMLAVYLYPRTDQTRLSRLGFRALGARKLGVGIFCLLATTAFTSGVLLDRLMDQGMEAEWRQDRADEYALRNRVKWGDPNQKLPEYQSLDLKVAFYPAERRFEMDGLFTIVNRTDEAFRVLPLTMSPDFDIKPEQHIYLLAQGVDGESTEVEAVIDDRNGLYEVALPEMLLPGQHRTLHMTYGGVLNPGSGKTSGEFGEWIFADAIFVDSFGSTLLPTVGYVDSDAPSRDTADSRLTPRELAQHYDGDHAALLGGRGTFSVKLEVSVPSDLTVLSVGTRTGKRIEGDRAIFNYEADRPVNFFPIMAGRYEVERLGDTAVYYQKGHEQNIDTILAAADQSRRFFSAIFSPYPFKELRIVEVPRFATFGAMGHPTINPFNEGHGFLTKGDDGISNINFIVTTHEAAHQWWGSVIIPAPVPGAPFLTESLAHYSTLLMEERFNGRVAARNRRIEYEMIYVVTRAPDVERPIVRIDGSERSDRLLWYDKGAMVFWMISETIGRENFIAALRSFIGEFSFQYDHPTIHDLLRHIRAHAQPEHEEFINQWFYDVVLPKVEVTSASSEEIGGGYVTTALIKNSGSGIINLEVEVANRRRLSTAVGIEPSIMPFSFDDLPDPYGWEEELKNQDENETKPDEQVPYRAVRAAIILSPGEEKEISIETPFEPGHILLDPDANILMGGRQLAQRALQASF